MSDRLHSTDAARISVIVPALDEAGCIERVLRAAEGAFERIVVDGGSRDGTADRARAAGARVLAGPRGRARQMNTGAVAASGDVLLFLHADTELPAGWAPVVAGTLSPAVAAGAFRLRTDGRGPAMRALEWLVNWRSCRMRMPYGDQGLFMRRETFEAVGGFPDLPVMEDYALVRALRRRGRIAIAETAVTTSARRWRQRGLLRTTLVNQACVAAYRAGVDPRRIASWRG